MKTIFSLLIFILTLPCFGAENFDSGVNDDFEEGEFYIDESPLPEIPKLGEIPEFDTNLDDVFSAVIDFKNSLRETFKREAIDVESLLKENFQSERLDFTPFRPEIDLTYATEINPNLDSEEGPSDLQRDSMALCAGVSEELAHQLEDTFEVGDTKALEGPSLLEAAGKSKIELDMESSSFSEVGKCSLDVGGFGLLEDSHPNARALEDSKSSKSSAIKSIAYKQCMQLTAPRSKKSGSLTKKSTKNMSLDELFKVYNKVSKK